MKKILSIASLAGLLVLPAVSLAVAETSPQTAPTVVTSGTSLIALITIIGNWAFAAVLAVSAIFLIYAGFLWVTAGGNPEGATKARTMLTNALIGVVVALLARGLVQVIRSIIGG